MTMAFRELTLKQEISTKLYKKLDEILNYEKSQDYVKDTWIGLHCKSDVEARTNFKTTLYISVRVDTRYIDGNTLRDLTKHLKENFDASLSAIRLTKGAFEIYFDGKKLYNLEE